MFTFLKQYWIHIGTKISNRLKWIRWLGRVLFMLLLIDLGYIWGLIPDWRLYSHDPIQMSKFIQVYQVESQIHKDWPKLKWNPVPLKYIPAHVIQSVIVAEDNRFYQHNGIDQDALKNAFEYNLTRGTIIYGGSTISQQTVKNLFFTSSRNPLRKWHEIILTFLMERHLKKQRILEYYLNVAEFGRGIYGVEAASQHYWDTSVINLNPSQAAELAATLPGPINHNPITRTPYFAKHLKKIKKHLNLG